MGTFFLARYWKWLLGTLIAALIALTTFGVHMQRRRADDLARLIELHVAMQRWEHSPQDRVAHLERLNALFRRCPQMLERFGGEFLQSAHLLGRLHDKSDPWIERALTKQLSQWMNLEQGERLKFEEVSLQAIDGQWLSVAKSGELWPVPLADPCSAKSENFDAPALQPPPFAGWRAYHLMRRFAAAQLANDSALCARTQLELLEAAGEWRPPYATFLAAFTAGRLSLRDWAENRVGPSS